MWCAVLAVSRWDSGAARSPEWAAPGIDSANDDVGVADSSGFVLRSACKEGLHLRDLTLLSGDDLIGEGEDVGARAVGLDGL